MPVLSMTVFLEDLIFQSFVKDMESIKTYPSNSEDRKIEVMEDRDTCSIGTLVTLDLSI